MAQNESAVPIAGPAPTAAVTTYQVRTFAIRDPLTNAITQYQGVVMCDEYGEPLTPLSEDTGREIVKLLNSININLAQANGLLPID
jgi:hypothetical protein